MARVLEGRDGAGGLLTVLDCLLAYRHYEKYSSNNSSVSS